MTSIFIIVLYIFIGFFIYNLVFKNKKEFTIKPEEASKASKFKEYFKEFQEDPEYQELNNSKLQKFINKSPAKIIISCILFMVLISFLSQFFKEFNFLIPIFIMISFIILIVVVVIITRHTSKIAKIYKEKIVKKMFDEFYPGFTYLPYSGLTNSEYAFRGYVGSYDDYYTDDYIKFELKGIGQAEMSNVKTTRTDTDSEGNTTTVTTFSGIYGRIELPLVNTYKVFGVGPSLYSGKNKIEMDNDEFRKRYGVHTQDEVFAYKVLTPDIMDKLLELRKQHGNIDFLLIGKTLYFRHSCGSMFDLANSEDAFIKAMLHYNREIDFVIKLLTKVSEHIIEKDS